MIRPSSDGIALFEELHLVAERFCNLLYTGLTYDHVFGDRPTDTLDPLLILGDFPDTLCYKDVNYADQERSGWDATRHYSRLQNTLTLNGRERLQKDAPYREKMIALLRYWLLHDYKNPNWWHNEIGMPRTISDITLMMWDVLPDDLRSRALELISRGSMKCHKNIMGWTGANLIWGINNTVKHALLTRDADLLALAASRALDEMRYDAEGIQEDGGFCQHGRRWYSGGYGASFTFDVAILVNILQGTRWRFPDDKLEIFLRHVLDGQRVMSKNGYFDYCGIGREYARVGNVYRTNLHKGVTMLAAVRDIPRADELAAFAKENARPAALCDDADADKTVFYPSIQLLCHRKHGSYIGVKGHNHKIYDQELCNGEGELAYNMSYGSHTCLARRGDEYYDLSPLWDFAHIPGTTARLENDEQIHAHRDWWCLPLPNDHSGGLSDGDCGILYEKPEHDGISALVSFFTYDGCLVSLGTDITDAYPERGNLTTTVDQCRLQDMVADRQSPMRHVSNGEWTYFNLDGETAFRVEAGERIGSWRRNNHAVPHHPVKGNVFMLCIPTDLSHPRFAYMAVPRERTGGAVNVLRNDRACQAIVASRQDSKKTLLAVFHDTATLTLPDGQTLSGESGRCLILPL